MEKEISQKVEAMTGEQALDYLRSNPASLIGDEAIGYYSDIITDLYEDGKISASEASDASMQILSQYHPGCGTDSNQVSCWGSARIKGDITTTTTTLYTYTFPDSEPLIKISTKVDNNCSFPLGR